MGNKEKKRYGELENVLLTDEEYGKLKQKFPDDYEDRINAVSFYIDSVGKNYKSHYATILNWDRRDKEKKTQIGIKKRNAFCNFAERGKKTAEAEMREKKEAIKMLERLNKKRATGGSTV